MKHDSTHLSRTKWLRLLLNQLRGNLPLRLSFIFIVIVTVYMLYISLHGSLPKQDVQGATFVQEKERDQAFQENPLKRDGLVVKDLEPHRDSLALRLLSHSDTKDDGLTQKVIYKFRFDNISKNQFEEPPLFQNISALLNNATVHKNPPPVPIKCTSGERFSDILKLKPIKFLPNYKNPCWKEHFHEPLSELYKANGFAEYSPSYKKALVEVRKILIEQRTSYRIRCLPYFLLAGQPKSGSTDLYKRLISHPDIVSPPTKESHWWGKNRYGWCLQYAHPIPFKDYLDLYDRAALEIQDSVEDSPRYGRDYHSVVTGDASVSTLWSNDDWWTNPENCGLTEPLYTNAHYVKYVLPHVKIIVILRNPTDRLYSDYLYFRDSKSKEEFHKEVILAINSLEKCFAEMGLRSCVYNATIANSVRVRLRIGLYQVYLQDWLSVFPPDQIEVLRLEDYAAEPLETIKRIYKFLDLRILSHKENKDVLDQPKWNTRRLSDKHIGSMKIETRKLLDDFYHTFNVKLARLMKDERFLWKDVKVKQT